MDCVWHWYYHSWIVFIVIWGFGWGYFVGVMHTKTRFKKAIERRDFNLGSRE